MASGSNESTPGAAAQKKLLKLTHKRLERFVTLVPKFFVNDNPDTIHDLRVWSRRLQQTLRITLPQTKTPASRKVVRTLRRVRQALGPCRNLDVNIEIARRRSQEAQSAISREGWEALGMHLQESRDSLLAKARKEVARYDFVAFIERARKLIAHADLGADPTPRLETAVDASMSEWDEAYRLAQESRSVDHLHAWRIATKRLRYRAELWADSGSVALKPVVKDLKVIQAALGDWHDRCLLLEFAAEFLARPDFLVQHPDQGSALLADMENEKKRNDAAMENVLSRAAKLRKRWNGRQIQGRNRAAKNADQ